jgi:hypothetical protein
MKQKDAPEPTRPSDFKDFVRRIVAVPKEELEQKEREFKRKRAKRKAR